MAILYINSDVQMYMHIICHMTISIDPVRLEIIVKFSLIMCYSVRRRACKQFIYYLYTQTWRPDYRYYIADKQ